MSKIMYNSENKNGIINGLNTCINGLAKINDIFYNIDIPYDFNHKNLLIGLNEKLKKSKNDILDYKDDINRYMEEINKKELEILSDINTIEEIIIDKF